MPATRHDLDPTPEASPARRPLRGLVGAAVVALSLAACGELQPVEFTRASTVPPEMVDLDDLIDDPTDTPPTSQLRRARYEVQPGESLGGIASQFGISMEVLMSANGITDPNSVEAGRELVIPGPDATVPPPWMRDDPDAEVQEP